MLSKTKIKKQNYFYKVKLLYAKSELGFQLNNQNKTVYEKWIYCDLDLNMDFTKTFNIEYENYQNIIQIRCHTIDFDREYNRLVYDDKEYVFIDVVKSGYEFVARFGYKGDKVND